MTLTGIKSRVGTILAETNTVRLTFDGRFWGHAIELLSPINRNTTSILQFTSALHMIQQTRRTSDLYITCKVGTGSSFLRSRGSITSSGVIKRGGHRLADDLFCLDFVSYISLVFNLSTKYGCILSGIPLR